MPGKREIARADVMPMERYARERAALRRRIIELKRDRRVAVGPLAMLYFESYETMWHQVHEMLFIEKGGEEQIPGELDAYNALIPQGDELVATLMFEIDEPDARRAILGRLGGVERTAFLEVGGIRIEGRAAADLERSTAAGRASAVQFIHFQFSPQAVAKFREPGARVAVGLDHPQYAHMAVVPESVRKALAEDFD
ncbi:MAG: DUF3501 family protein [Alphaproteobacteria bacterium]